MINISVLYHYPPLLSSMGRFVYMKQNILIKASTLNYDRCLIDYKIDVRFSMSRSQAKLQTSFQESRVYFRHYEADCMPSFNPIMVEGYFVVWRWFRPQTQWRLRCEARNSWLKPDDCLWLDPPWFN